MPEGAKRGMAAWSRARAKITVMTAAIAPLSGWRGDSMREAVEAALDAEDITPLVLLLSKCHIQIIECQFVYVCIHGVHMAQCLCCNTKA